MNYAIKALAGVLAISAGIIVIGTHPWAAALAFAAAALAFAPPLKNRSTK